MGTRLYIQASPKEIEEAFNLPAGSAERYKSLKRIQNAYEWLMHYPFGKEPKITEIRKNGYKDSFVLYQVLQNDEAYAIIARHIDDGLGRVSARAMEILGITEGRYCGTEAVLACAEAAVRAQCSAHLADPAPYLQLLQKGCKLSWR